MGDFCRGALAYHPQRGITMSLASRLVSVLVAMAASAAILMACSSDSSTPAGTGVTGTVVPDAGDAGEDAPGEAAAAADSGLKGNAVQGCTKDAECESGHCFIGGNQSFCTVPCTVAMQATVCVPPFTGTCNKQGFCKRD
jgi:hypothetical protein